METELIETKPATKPTRPGDHSGKLVVPPKGVRYGGRAMGTQNKMTRTIKEALVMAAESVGEDGKGTDGLFGYLRRVALRDHRTFCAMLGRIIPMQVQAKIEGYNAIRVEVVGIPASGEGSQRHKTINANADEPR